MKGYVHTREIAKLSDTEIAFEAGELNERLRQVPLGDEARALCEARLRALRDELQQRQSARAGDRTKLRVLLAALRALESRVPAGPWHVWDGPEYMGGGADLCIGQGDKWLLDVDHRAPRCPQIHDDGHKDHESCDICSLDADAITGEQAAIARYIAWTRNQMPRLIEGLGDLLRENEELRTAFALSVGEECERLAAEGAAPAAGSGEGES